MLVLAVIAGCGSAPSRSATVSGPGFTVSETPEPPDSKTTGPTTGTSTSTTTITGTMTKHPSLESTLFELVRAENRTAFATEHGIDVRDGRVLVVVELENGTDLPDGYDPAVASEFGTSVEAYVDIDDLVSLAGEGNVRVVRTPTEAHPQG